MAQTPWYLINKMATSLDDLSSHEHWS
jgi:hypothetical protein